MPVPYQKHGRRHAPTGEDPIPGLGATGGSGFPLYHDFMWPHMINSSDGGISGYGYGTKTASRFGNFYIEATALNDYFYGIARLGPAGSFWSFDMCARRGTDGGQLTVSIAQLSEDHVTYGAGALESIDDGPATFYDLYRDTSPSTANADFYSGGLTEEDEYVVPQWCFRLNGADGDTLSAVTATTSPYEANDLDCGSGLYAFRFKTTGKNASSSGYRVRLHYLHLRRLTGSFLTV